MKPFTLLAHFLMLIVLVSFQGCASMATQEGTGEYIDVSVITTNVKAAIFADASRKSMEINVEAFKGMEQLNGFVNSRSDINIAVIAIDFAR